MQTTGRSQLTKEKDTLVVKIANQLADKILQGDIPPDTRLKVLDLTAKYHVSQMIIRDALSLLSKRNVVSVTARRGYFVRSFKGEEIVELWEIYKRLWGLAVRLFCQKAQADPMLISHLQETNEAIMARHASGLEAVNQASEFLMVVHRHCGNALLQDMLLDLEYPVRRLRWQLNQIIGALSDEGWVPILTFRTKLCQAVSANRPQEAELLMWDAADAEIQILSKVLGQLK